MYIRPPTHTHMTILQPSGKSGRISFMMPNSPSDSSGSLLSKRAPRPLQSQFTEEFDDDDDATVPKDWQIAQHCQQ